MTILRKYGVEFTVDFDLFEVDGIDFRVDAVHASGDTKVMKDEGVEANTTNGFTDEGQGYSLVVTATEAQAARIVIYAVDQTATKVWLDRTIIIETYGNASAQHAMDFDDAVRGGLTALPNAAADAAGGLPISDLGGFAVDGTALEATLGTPTDTDIATDIANVQSDTNDLQTRVPAALAGGKMDSDMTSISGDSVAADNVEATYDGTGYTDDNAPAKQSQVENISTVGAAVHVTAVPSPGGFVITTGTEVGDEDRTVALDGVKHELSDAAGTLDVLYKFDIGGDAAPVSVTFTGNFNSNNDSFDIFGNTGTDATPVWVQIGTIDGVNSTANTVHTFNMFNNMIVSDVAGEVQIRIQATGLSSSSFDVDQVFVSKSDTSRSAGYQNGQLWIDTTGKGTAGTENYVNATADNTVDLWASAIIIANSLGMADFHIINGSDIVFGEGNENHSLVGDHWTLDLSGEDCSGLYVSGATVFGTGTTTGEEMHFEGCDFLAPSSLERAHFDKCGFSSTVTMTASVTNDFDLHGCYSKGVGVPTFTKVTGFNLNFETIDYEGDITINGIEVGDSIELQGFFRTVTVIGTGGTVHVHGHYQTIVSGSFSGTLEIDGAIKTEDSALTLADTNELQGDWTNGGRLDLLLDAIKAVTDLLPDAGALSDLAAILLAQGTFVVDNATDLAANQTDLDSILTNIAALNDVSVADLLAQASAALDTTTYAEPSGPPTWPMTVTEAQFWAAVLSIQKLTETATTLLARNSADSATLGTSTVSDDGTTAIRGKFV